MRRREGDGFDGYADLTVTEDLTVTAKKRTPKGRRTGGCFHPRRDGLALI